ncbi:EutN/CcmL family microcompartment protein [Clostridium botulinum]|uniref:EutN/CcmL family microcompartment protein n=1 Tax=Clostridium botulinum TaxID=1491 RepID=UPI0007737CEB|nr:EutN/CcmL family microcompartment protein [Clostridium botulinum]MBN1061872.1 ethanolamine utilization protein EutN [Clostridium botulinum]MBY6931136.1 EutN/CcmL family microcompartment protein [Clostridium botulinum]NFG20038.1 ethanolamine utilization protein EutN [Clostridium botulinum]NFO81973.1 ethanolamine utilization protein EutN [Clostridium botulinum]HBJ1647088.1 EutN/CcmL family microcompartment protein [Clostridium botulinum]
MYLAKVVGVVVATTKSQGLVGKKMLMVKPLTPEYNPAGNIEVAIDSVGAGNGELVLVATGYAAHQQFNAKDAPIDRAIIAIVDSVEVSKE